MNRIGGNVTGLFQVRTVTSDDYGEQLETWVDLPETVIGFIDYLGGQNNIRDFDTKLAETTHIFICDYKNLNIDERNTRLVINNKTYEILKIDNPMELNQHYEIYLKYIGVA